jgi:hypothetical protein
MRKILQTTLLFMGSSMFLWAQTSSSILVDFPKSNTAAISSKVSYTFKLVKNDRGVQELIINETVSEKVISLKGSTYFVGAVSYDNYSSINEFEHRNERNKISNRHIIQRSNLESNGIFHDDNKLFTFSLDMSSKDDIAYFSYVKTYKDPKYFTKTFFQESYPIVEKTISVTIPSWLQIQVFPRNFTDAIKVSETKNSKGEKVLRYSMSKIQEFANESNAPGITYYAPHLVFSIQSYTDKKGLTTEVFKSTEDVYKWYRVLLSQMNNDPSVFKPLVTELTQNCKTEEEKIKRIFFWIQDNIRYVAYEDGIAGFKPANCQDVFNLRYGDCKGMSNLLKNMLSLINVDARLTWVGTRHLNYDHSIPALCVDNHMICTLIKDGKKVFLDPTETFVDYGKIAHRIQGREAMIENGDQYMLEKIQELDEKENRTLITEKIRLNNELLQIKGKAQYDGENKRSLLNFLDLTEEAKKEERIKNFISNENTDIKISQLNYSDLKDRKGKMTFDYMASVKNKTFVIQKKKYVQIECEQEFKYFTFKEERKLDYVFSEKYALSKEIEFEIPPGHKVEYLPESFSAGNKNFTISVQISQSGGSIRYKKEIIIRDGKISKAEFKDWNEAILKLRKFYDDTIVLSF